MENPLIRVYIINASDLIVTREAPVEPGEDEIIVGSLEELRAARLSGKRLLALWNGLPGVARLSRVGEHDALVDRLWAAFETLTAQAAAIRNRQTEAEAKQFRGLSANGYSHRSTWCETLYE
jgi:hypothetical protein